MFRLMIAFLFFAFATSVVAAPEQTLELNITAIQDLTNLKGMSNDKDNSFKIVVPRDDLAVTINGVKLTSAMGLSSWMTFKKIQGLTVMKGELVLTDTQVDPIMGATLNNHIAVTALHSHFMWDSPKIMFMRVEAVGSEQDIAKAMGKIFARINETSKGNGEFPVATIDTSNTTLNATQVNNIVRAKGYGKDGVYKVAVGGSKVNAQVVFAGSDYAAVMDGDFVVSEADLQNVLKELHKAKIQIVSIHQQIANDGQSPVVAVHFWGIGNPKSLAKGVRFGMNAARLYSKDQILVQAKEPVPTFTKRVMGTVKQKIVQTAPKLLQSKPIAIATQLAKTNVAPAPTIAEAPAPARVVIQYPVPVLQTHPIKSNNLVKQAIEKMQFGKPRQIGLAQPAAAPKPKRTTVSAAKPTPFNPTLVKNVMDKMAFGG